MTDGAPRPRRARPWILGLGAALALSLGLQAALHAARGVPSVLPAPADASARPGDVSYGRADAPVTVVALLSLTCVHCRAWEEAQMPAVLRDLVGTGKVRLVLRPFPLDGTALSGAVLVSCLPEAERPAAHAALVAAGGAWDAADPATVASAAGLSGERALAAAACAASPEAARAVAETALAARRDWGAAVTPTFVVGRRVQPGALPASGVAALVDAARAP